jgi:hypothetical protein
MFIQVVRAKVEDADAIRSSLERWERDLAPGASGFLGSTAGVTDDGTFFAVVRFESTDAAEANSARPEQDAWWDETMKFFSDGATFYNCPIVDAYLEGCSDEAGFVQVTTCRVSDVSEARKFGAQFAEIAPRVRPDLLGFVDAFISDGRCVTTSYFRSEKEAREGEKAEMPAEHQAVFEGFRELVSDFEYFDLRNPRLFTAP